MTWQLGQKLPPVLLLQGNHTAGLAEQLRLEAFSVLDRIWLGHLDVQAAEFAHRWAFTAPTSNLKVAVIDLDGATAAGLTRMLKLLEEPPDHIRFILLSTYETWGTIRSRAQVYYVGDTWASDVLATHKNTVIAVLNAARSGDSTRLGTLLKNWDPSLHRMLGIWCQESLSGRWHHFDASDVPGVPRQFTETLFLELIGSARPKLVARAALEAAARTEK